MQAPASNSSERVHVHLTVQDMKVSIDFYTAKLGFFYDHGVLETAWLTAPRLLLSLSPGEPGPAPKQYFGFSLESCEALTAKYDQLRQAGVPVSNAPEPRGQNQHFFVYDPDAYVLIFSYVPLEYPRHDSCKL